MRHLQSWYPTSGAGSADALYSSWGERDIYIYIYVVELLSGPSLGVLNVIIWSKFVFFL